MSNRIIKESICSSEKISNLSDFEFRLWVGLITQADDAGRGDARPAIIKGRVFPLRDRVTVKDIDVALHALAAKGCVSLYTVGGRPYFWFPSWADHQRIRDYKPKYPGPDEADADDFPQPVTNGGQQPPMAASGGLNSIQSESKSESKTVPPLPPSNVEALFNDFWAAYPRKVGKGEARKAWAKLKPSRELTDKILKSVALWKESAEWDKEDGRYIPNPSTWLNQGRWEDEPRQKRRASSYRIEDLEGPMISLPDGWDSDAS